MSRLNRLIAELCPDGVEYKTIRDIVKKNIGGGTPSKANPNYWNGAIPWASVKDLIYNGLYISKTKDHITTEGLKNSSSNIVEQNWLVICTRINPGLCKIASCTIAINQDLRGLLLKDEANVKYVYYFFQTISITGRGTTVKGVSVDELNRITIPLPPLPIQEEIVRILDSFTELETELETELDLRKKQYEYYRDTLLDFSNKSQYPSVRWMKLGEIGTLVRGSGLQKKDFTDKGVGCIHYGQIYTYYRTFTSITKSFVSLELAKTLKKVNKNDLIITNTSENVEDVCKTVAWLGDHEIVTGGHATIFKHNENPKYLAYYTQTPMFFNEKKKIAFGTKVTEVSVANLAKIKIPIPPLSEQKRIVSILDRFDKLTNDISVGLPAEIAARHKQYEYYRDSLLSFKEKVS